MLLPVPSWEDLWASPGMQCFIPTAHVETGTERKGRKAQIMSYEQAEGNKHPILEMGTLYRATEKRISPCDLCFQKAEQGLLTGNCRDRCGFLLRKCCFRMKQAILGGNRGLSPRHLEITTDWALCRRDSQCLSVPAAY